MEATWAVNRRSGKGSTVTLARSPTCIRATSSSLKSTLTWSLSVCASVISCCPPWLPATGMLGPAAPAGATPGLGLGEPLAGVLHRRLRLRDVGQGGRHVCRLDLLSDPVLGQGDLKLSLAAGQSVTGGVNLL